MVARSVSFFCSVFGSAYCLLLYFAPPSLSLLIPNFLFPFLQSLFAEKQMEQRRLSGFSFAVSLPFSILSSLFLFFCSLFALFLSVFTSVSRSLEGLIYSLTYLYLGRIQCINPVTQIPTDLQ